MPQQIQDDYALACRFSNFLYVLRTIYNIIVSNDQSKEAQSEWQKLKEKLDDFASIDLEAVFKRLYVYHNVFLCGFLRREQMLMLQGDLEGMKTEIKRRERELKQSRAKTMHPGEFDTSVWYGGKTLDYRFANAKVIIRDIFESEE